MIKSTLIFTFFTLLFINNQGCKETPSTPTVPTTTPTTEVVRDSIMPEHLASAAANYNQFCADCHGKQLESFVDRTWAYGSTDAALYTSIKEGYPDNGMPGFVEAFSEKQLNLLVEYLQWGKQQVPDYQFSTVSAADKVYSSEKMNYQLDEVVSGLENPWGLAFLPNGDMLITEINGTLYRKVGNKLITITGTPPVVEAGQGGLLDVAVHPDFTKNKWVYFSYSKGKMVSGKQLATTAIIRAKLEGDKLIDAEELFEALPYSKTRHHYGSRIVFDKKGYLFFSVGDRGNREENPQSLENHCGKIHRLNADGTVPKSNPFVKTPNAMPSIYSYGHRNPQGLAMHPITGKIWSNEHGPKGGDELNVLEEGLNYGWPVISYGVNYIGTKFTDITAKKGMEQPVTYWKPSIATCGLAFADARRYPAWQGDAFTGSLKFDYVVRCRIKEEKVIEQEILFENIGRVRNVVTGSDGYMYVSTESPGSIYRVIPTEK